MGTTVSQLAQRGSKLLADLRPNQMQDYGAHDRSQDIEVVVLVHHKITATILQLATVICSQNDGGWKDLASAGSAVPQVKQRL